MSTRTLLDGLFLCYSAESSEDLQPSATGDGQRAVEPEAPRTELGRARVDSVAPTVEQTPVAEPVTPAMEEQPVAGPTSPGGGVLILPTCQAMKRHGPRQGCQVILSG